VQVVLLKMERHKLRNKVLDTPLRSEDRDQLGENLECLFPDCEDGVCHPSGAYGEQLLIKVWLA